MDKGKKKILITGGAGFIGSHLADRLLAEGAEVSVIDNLSTGSRENLDLRAAFHEMDIRDGRLADVFEILRPDTVYHLAANSNVPLSIENPLFDFESLEGALKVLELCRRTGVRMFVFASSGFIYGNVAARPIREDQPFYPISPYAISKHAIEDYLKFYRDVYGLPFAVLRFATVYGPRQIKGAMADYIRKLSAGQQAEFYGEGDKTRDYVYIDDAVEALSLAASVPPDCPAPVFNIGSGTETSLLEIYKTVASLLGRDPSPVRMPSRPGELNGYSLDASLAKAVLGWTPRRGLKEGLALTVDWHRRRK